MKRVILHDIDSHIPNLALMKLSTHYRNRGWEVRLLRVPRAKGKHPAFEGDLHLASAVFFTDVSRARLQALQDTYGNRIEVGGSGFSLEKRLSPDIDALFPDYSLYDHSLYALGFLTRGCNKRCSFCVVPAKEGRLKRLAYSFDDFVPPNQRNVMLLDDNLLAFSGVESLLEEMIRRRYAVNFSQTLDIAYLSEEKAALLRQIDYQSARFSNRMIYFSLNYARTNHHFADRRDLLRAFGEDCVTVVCIYGFDTSLSEDYQRFHLLRRFRLIPFFQEYWPIRGVPSRLPAPFFDMDLKLMIRLTFRANGYNWEKYLRWLNRRYFEEFGRFYRPLVEVIFRYNYKHRLQWYLDRADWMTDEMYRDFRDSPPGGARTFLAGLGTGRQAGLQASNGIREIAAIFDEAAGMNSDPLTRASV